MPDESWFEAFEHKFLAVAPSDRNGFSLFPEKWKFDFERMSIQEVIKSLGKLGIPQMCAELFPNFSEMDVLELGPAEGYHAFLLEKWGAKSVLSIEGNIEAFLKCLVLKNALNLRTKFMLGDFTQYITRPNFSTDLLFASGVLYHLMDPVRFLARCGETASHLYLWTFYFDEASIQNNPYEKARFVVDPYSVDTQIGTYTQYERKYEPIILSSPKYSGGLQSKSIWLDRHDLLRAVHSAGFDVIKTMDDTVGGLPAVNIFATNRRTSFTRHDKTAEIKG